ncbi:MAG: hypothetical protein ACRDWE_14445, partial [Acidimicrobiales bacterium]
GMAALDAIERAGCNVLATDCRPRPTRLAARLALVVLSGTSAARATAQAAATASVTAPVTALVTGVGTHP